MVRVVVRIRAVRKLTLGVAVVFKLVLVLFVATIALGVMGLGLASTTTVLTLLDGATLRVDMMQVAVCKVTISPCSQHVVERSSVRFTSMVAAAHSMTLDTGRACPFLAIDDRHPAG
jgi:hypothetical protein